MTPLEFGGVDTGTQGGVVLLRLVDHYPEADRLALNSAVLAPLPMRARDEGGHELDGAALARLLADPWRIAVHRRLVVERPSTGGQRMAGNMLRQFATWGGCVAIAEAACDKHAGHMVDEARADGGGRRGGWRAELELPPIKDPDERKLANVAAVEDVLADIALGVAVSRLGLELAVAQGFSLQQAGAIARGYGGRLHGPAPTRSGVADAFLLALVGVRRWLVGRRR